MTGAVLDFEEIERRLTEAKAVVGAAECHGTFSGILCAGGGEPELWLDEILGFDSSDDFAAVANPLLELALELWQNAESELDSEDFDYSLLLPDDGYPLTQRTRSLALWCQGFLFGFGSSGQPAALDEVGEEFIRDVREVCRVDSDRADEDDEDQEQEQEQAFAELVEYIRIGALTLRQEALLLIVAPTPGSGAPENWH